MNKETVRLVMSDLGSRKKTMTPAALEARRNAARKTKPEVEIIIEPGIAIPRVKQQNGKWRNIVLSMNYGDSVLLPRKESQCLKQAVMLHGDKAIARAEDGKIRVWKLKKS